MKKIFLIMLLISGISLFANEQSPLSETIKLEPIVVTASKEIMLFENEEKDFFIYCENNKYYLDTYFYEKEQTLEVDKSFVRDYLSGTNIFDGFDKFEIRETFSNIFEACDNLKRK